MWITLCVVDANKTRIPVCVPYMQVTPKVGDILFFEIDGVEKMGDVVFCEDYQHPDDKVWNALVATTELEPVRATKLAQMVSYKWEEKDGQED